MYEKPSRYVPGPPVHEAEAPPPPRGPVRRFVVPFLLFAVLVSGGSYGAMPDPDVTVLPGVAFADDGTVLVPYERDGTRGLLQFLTQDEVQVRQAVVDPATGAVRADTRLPGDIAPAAPAAPPASPTAGEAPVPGTGERVVLRDLPFGMPGQQLVRVTAAGSHPLGGVTFTSGSLVVAGLTARHVLVQHQDSVNGHGIALSVVSIDSGLVTATLPVDDPVAAAVAGPGGTVALTAGPALVLVHGGRATRVELGTPGFFESFSG